MSYYAMFKPTAEAMEVYNVSKNNFGFFGLKPICLKNKKTIQNYCCPLNHNYGAKKTG